MHVVVSAAQDSSPFFFKLPLPIVSLLTVCFAKTYGAVCEIAPRLAPPSPPPRDTAWAMSQENVEIVRAVYSAINTGTFEAASKLYAPDIELRDLQNAPDQPVVITGVEALGHVWASWTAAFDVFSADVTEYIDAGDAVVAAANWHGQGKTSGLAIDNRQFDVFELRGGKVARVTLGYRSKADALEAAGLAE
jgi:ketosteroid isomerase-like protein